MSWEVIGKGVVAKPVLIQCGVIWANSDPWPMEGTFDPKKNVNINDKSKR